MVPLNHDDREFMALAGRVVGQFERTNIKVVQVNKKETLLYLFECLRACSGKVVDTHLLIGEKAQDLSCCLNLIII